MSAAEKDAPEIARLRAEVAHWKDHAEEAGRGFARVCEDYARVSARNVALVDALEGARDDIKARIATFRELDADAQYLEALNDAWGLVANRVRSVLLPPPTYPGGAS